MVIWNGVIYYIFTMFLSVCASNCNSYTLITGQEKRSSLYQLELGEDPAVNDALLAAGWYKFGSTIGDDMPTSAPGSFKCGTWYPIWFSGNLPVSLNDVVTGDGCVQTFKKICARTVPIKIEKCQNYYVYYLQSSNTENSAYCIGSKPVPCPVGFSSENGNYPGCSSNFPVETVLPSVVPELTLGPDLNVGKGNSTVTIVKCNFTEVTVNSGPSYLYDVIWYINDVKVITHKNIQYINIEDTYLTESDWYGKHRLNMIIRCTVRLRFNTASTPSLEHKSDVFKAGVFPERYEYQVQEGERIAITLFNTFPYGCVGHTDQDRKGCIYRLRLGQPKYQDVPAKCLNNIVASDLTFDRQKCFLSFTSFTWDQSYTVYVTGYVDGNYGSKQRTTYLKFIGQDNDPDGPNAWDDIEIPAIKIVVTDRDYEMAGRVCTSYNDPHMRSTDGLHYEFHDPGEFILYRHLTKRYQVNALFTKCNYGNTCNCGIAIKNGKSLFVYRTCSEIFQYSTTTHSPLIEMRSCDDSGMVIQENGGKYTITLDIGTEITFEASYAPWTLQRDAIGYIQIKPSLLDVDNVEGLCGHITNGSADTADDFRKRDNTVFQHFDAYAFGNEWRVQTDEGLFEPDNTFLNANDTVNLEQFCICNNETNSSTIQNGFNFKCGLQAPLSNCLSQTASASYFHTKCTLPRIGRSIHQIVSRSVTDSDDVIDGMFLNIASDEELTGDTPSQSSTKWPYGWSEESASDVCTSNIKQTITNEIAELARIDTDSYIKTCMFDIQLAGDTRYLQDTIASMQTLAISEISRNRSLFEDGMENGTATINTYSVGEILLSSLCPNNCSTNGQCQNGFCICKSGFGKQDCSADLSLPPRNISIPFGGKCNTRERACEKTNIQGTFNSRTVFCNSRHFQILSNRSLLYTSKTEIYAAVYKNTYLASCEFPSIKRSKRSTDEIILADGYEIRMSTDGTNFGDSVNILIYDESCVSCDVSNLTCTSLDSCSDGSLLPSSPITAPTGPTAFSTGNVKEPLSSIVSPTYPITSSSSSVESSTSKDKINFEGSNFTTYLPIIIGVVVGSIVLIAIGVFGCIYYKKANNKRRKEENNTGLNGKALRPEQTNVDSNKYNKEPNNASIGDLSIAFGNEYYSRPRTPVELFSPEQK